VNVIRVAVLAVALCFGVPRGGALYAVMLRHSHRRRFHAAEWAGFRRLEDARQFKHLVAVGETRHISLGVGLEFAAVIDVELAFDGRVLLVGFDALEDVSGCWFIFRVHFYWVLIVTDFGFISPDFILEITLST
jgi:hypothetical protein